MTEELPREKRLAVSRIGGLVIINAMIFQETLAGFDNRVFPLKKMLAHPEPIDLFIDHWKFIAVEINYFPIFNLAREILLSLTTGADVISAVRELANTAQKIINNRAALRHDLMGRIYHRLLVEAKFLGTYYTSIPAAMILLKLALRPSAWQTKWAELEEISQLRIADLACGTGTLLMAAADAITDNYVSTAKDEGEPVRINELQNLLAENVLYGYDVLPSAIHLTASTLALRAPNTAFSKMNLFSLPLGGPQHRLGSIEFLTGERPVQIPMDMFGSAPTMHQVTGDALEESTYIAPVPKLDVCVMNPPFTRSVGGNLLFGSVPEAERIAMQQDLKKLVAKVEKAYRAQVVNITAGLGSVFVIIADRYLKPGGRIGLVLPKSLLSGVAWSETRRLLQHYYRVEFLIASHDPERWNFSESTDLSEVLLIAVKNDPTEPPDPNNRVITLNLWRNPTTAFEALAIANNLLLGDSPGIQDGQGASEIYLGKQKVGESLAFPWDGTSTSLKQCKEWIMPCAFGQSDLIRAAYHLTQGELWLPGHGLSADLQLSTLEAFGVLGPDRRDIHDGFRLSKSPTAYPAFWGHDAKSMVTLAQKANTFLSPLHQAKPGRNLRRVEDLWPLAGSILLVERMRLNTQALAAARLEKPALANVWWTLSLKSSNIVTETLEKSLTLWLNSTLGLLILLSSREETEGAWIDFKKPVLARLPILDFRTLTQAQLNMLADTYDRFCSLPLLPLPYMADDPVRIEIDQAIAVALNLPDFSILRRLLAREPVVCLQRL